MKELTIEEAEDALRHPVLATVFVDYLSLVTRTGRTIRIEPNGECLKILEVNS